MADVIKKQYKLPFAGTVLSENPLTGDPNDPIRVLDLSTLPGYPSDKTFGFRCDEWNVQQGWIRVVFDAEQDVHAWLKDQLRGNPAFEELP